VHVFVGRMSDSVGRMSDVGYADKPRATSKLEQTAQEITTTIIRQCHNATMPQYILTYEYYNLFFAMPGMVGRSVRNRRNATATCIISRLIISVPLMALLYALFLLNELVTETRHDEGFNLSFHDAQLHPGGQQQQSEELKGKFMNAIVTSKKDSSMATENKSISGERSETMNTNSVQLLKSDALPWLETKSVQLKASHPPTLMTLNAHDPPFQIYDRVVITTKVHWYKSVGPLKRMLCLLTAAYNRFVNYDIVVFTTIPWTDEQVLDLARTVAPAKLTIAIDGPSLEEHLASMTKEEVTFLEKRCSVKPGEKLSWFHHCTEEEYGTKANLGYSWQSEFRAYHIWKHEALENYKWMIWMDSDALCTKTWDKDPIKAMVENNLTAMYDNFPAGVTKGIDLKEKMMEAYGYAICGIWENADGTWKTRRCRDVDVAWVNHIHGFHHITNLDVYRSEKHMKWLKLMVGDYRFSRKWDDQLGVTIPAAFEAPERVWDLQKHNMTLMIRHNGQYDGKGSYVKVRSPEKWWVKEGRGNWTAAKILCDDCLLPKKALPGSK
jgi:hypothetical protein